MSRSGLTRRLLPVVLLPVLAAAAAGCSGNDDPGPEPTADPTVTVESAPATYRPLVSAVVDAVGAAVAVPGRPDGDPEVVYYAADLGGCVFSSLRYEFDTVFGEETSWDEVRSAVAGAVGPGGLELTDQLDVPGGYNGFDAEADDGTRLEVRSKLGDPSTISLDAPVTGDCPREGSQTVSPAG